MLENSLGCFEAIFSVNEAAERVVELKDGDKDADDDPGAYAQQE
jgi:hypothetical protein